MVDRRAISCACWASCRSRWADATAACVPLGIRAFVTVSSAFWTSARAASSAALSLALLGSPCSCDSFVRAVAAVASACATTCGSGTSAACAWSSVARASFTRWSSVGMSALSRADCSALTRAAAAL